MVYGKYIRLVLNGFHKNVYNDRLGVHNVEVWGKKQEIMI